MLSLERRKLVVQTSGKDTNMIYTESGRESNCTVNEMTGRGKGCTEECDLKRFYHFFAHDLA